MHTHIYIFVSLYLYTVLKKEKLILIWYSYWWIHTEQNSSFWSFPVIYTLFLLTVRSLALNTTNTFTYLLNLIIYIVLGLLTHIPVRKKHYLAYRSTVFVTVLFKISLYQSKRCFPELLRSAPLFSPPPSVWLWDWFVILLDWFSHILVDLKKLCTEKFTVVYSIKSFDK